MRARAGRAAANRHAGMGWRAYTLLALLGLAMALAVAHFQSFPGYMDADYYFGGGLQLLRGRGFTEPYLWNYLSDPAGLPSPSHLYWMPLASVIAAAGMRLTGQADYASARLGFVALAAASPVATAALAFSFSRRSGPAVLSGLLAVFSVYYVPFLPVPDNYGVYQVLGAIFLLAVGRRVNAAYVTLGLAAGLMTLARSDGILWLFLAIAASARGTPGPGLPSGGHAPDSRSLPPGTPGRPLAGMAIALAAFSIVVAPWYMRNAALQGTILGPGLGRLLWMRSYDEIFAYPASQLTLERWLAQDISTILSGRLASLRWNLLNAFAAQGGVFLLPLIVAGAWMHRKDPRVQTGFAGWSALLVVMTFVFPFVGARGGFFHAGAGFQPLWWALAPLGLERLVTYSSRFASVQLWIQRSSGAAMVWICMLMTGVIFYLRVLGGWGEGEGSYPGLEAFLERSGAKPGQVVMVRNPPGYYVMTNRPAIVVPYADAAGILAAARKYDAEFLVIEPAGAAGPIRAVYDDLNSQSLEFLGELDGTRIFRVEP